MNVTEDAFALRNITNEAYCLNVFEDEQQPYQAALRSRTENRTFSDWAAMNERIPKRFGAHVVTRLTHAFEAAAYSSRFASQASPVKVGMSLWCIVTPMLLTTIFGFTPRVAHFARDPGWKADSPQPEPVPEICTGR